MKVNIFKYIFIIVVIGLIVFSAYSIYKKNDVVEETEKTEEVVAEKQQLSNIRIGISKYDNMNPLLSTNKMVQYVDKLIFEPLLSLNEDFSLSNCLAKEYSKTGDNTYLIKLRDDVKWHDGMPLVAKDVQFTIDRLKDGQISSIYQENVRDVSQVEIIDEHTIKISLDKQVPFFEYNLIFPILPNHYYIDEDFAQSTRTPIGTGMYKIGKMESSFIELRKNETWWNREQKDSKIDTITLNLYSSMGEVYNAFKIGNIDLIPTSNSNFNQYIGTIGFNVKEYTARKYDVLAINTQNNVLQKREVRQAIASAIDKNNIVATVYNNTYVTSNYPLDYGNYLYAGDLASQEYNPEYAQKLLEDNGWTLRYRQWQKVENYRTLITSFSLVVNASNVPRVAVAESIKNQLKEIGIEISIRKVSDAQYRYYLENKNYDLILTGTNISASPSLETYFGEGNLANFTDERVTNIMNSVNSINDKKMLKENYRQLQQIYIEEVPYISLYRDKEYLVYSPNLVGELNPNWYNIFYNIENWYRQN